MNNFGMVISSIEELKEDNLPRSVVLKLDEALAILQSDCEAGLRCNKAMSVIESVSESDSLQSYTRSQLFNILSRLESQ